MSEKLYPVAITVNGARHEAEVPSRLTLVDFLRDTLRLTGTHVGCEHGICGACSILLDNEPVRSCLMYAVQVDGCAVTTIEGLSRPDGTPGMVVASHALLESNPAPTEAEIREAIGGNLCRCTGYQQIVEAVHLAASNLAKGTQ